MYIDIDIEEWASLFNIALTANVLHYANISDFLGKFKLFELMSSDMFIIFSEILSNLLTARI